MKIKLSPYYVDENGELYVRTTDFPYFERRLYWYGDIFQIGMQIPVWKIEGLIIKSKHFLN
jgi:hypothetical protein